MLEDDFASMMEELVPRMILDALGSDNPVPDSASSSGTLQPELRAEPKQDLTEGTLAPDPPGGGPHC